MRRDLLPDVKTVNVNRRASWQSAVSSHYHDVFRKKRIRHLIFSILSFGVFPYKLYKKAKRSVAQSLAARKLFFFRALQDVIEETRKDQSYKDPRQSLNTIFMKVQSEKVNEDEEALEFKAIFSPSEILLFITNPVRDRKTLQFYRLKSKGLDYLKMWFEIKRKARANQYRQIQNINFCNQSLKQDYCLTPDGVHDRLTRTSVSRKNISLLTKFKELSRGFQEIVLAYQEFEELSESNPELFHLLESLGKTSQKDVETLQTYLASRYLPRDLPLENRRQLIQLGNQQEVLYHISEEQQFNICALILNQYQWDFLVSIQEVSQVTLNLLDWAFEETSRSMKKPLSFLERVYSNALKKVRDDPENFPTLNEKISEDPNLEKMTIDFAKEQSREWPSMNLYEEDKLTYNLPHSDSLSQDHLIEVYHATQKLAAVDDTLFMLLQQALSQVGKNGFQSAIQDGVMQLLGEKSEYFLPILSNTNVTIRKHTPNEVDIRYTFEQVITKKGEVQHPFEKEKYMVITQPLRKIEGHWTSLDPETEIAVKQRIA